jgi:hypothetical protein
MSALSVDVFRVIGRPRRVSIRNLMIKAIFASNSHVYSHNYLNQHHGSAIEGLKSNCVIQFVIEISMALTWESKGTVLLLSRCS